MAAALVAMATAAPCGSRFPHPNISPRSPPRLHSSASSRGAICRPSIAPVFRKHASSGAFVVHPLKRWKCFHPSEFQRRLPSSKAWRGRGVAVAAVERQQPAPAVRDREVDFGKFKGAKMGTLSSYYLKWMVKNLKAGPLAEWSAYAEEVLADPYYRDRLEWEKVEKLMAEGHDVRRMTGSRDAVLAPAKMFGWDLQDDTGWRKVNFSLLGTSKGGRIPRVKAALAVPEKKRASPRQKKESISVRTSSMATTRSVSTSSNSDDDDVTSSGSLRDELMRRRAQRRDRVMANMGLLIGNDDEASDARKVLRDKFPGRESLLKTVRSYDISE